MTAPDPATEPHRFLEHLYHAAVRRALPLHNTAAFLPPPPRGRTIVLGAGKAGGSMAQAVEALWPADAPLEGLVVTRYHHIPPRPEELKKRIEIVEAAHPVPDANSMAAAQAVLQAVSGLGPDDLVFMTIGSLTENSDNGDHHTPARLDEGPAPAWDLWRPWPCSCRSPIRWDRPAP